MNTLSIENVLERIGGAEGDRTPDLMTASHALSQLSYQRFQQLAGWNLPHPFFHLLFRTRNYAF